jgi:hypothetical protein
VCFVLQYAGPICKKDISELLTLLEWYLLIPSTEMNALSLHLKKLLCGQPMWFCFGNFES